MKIKFVGGTRDGSEADVLDAAGRRLVESGVAEEVNAKATAKTTETKPAAKKASTSKSKAKSKS